METVITGRKLTPQEYTAFLTDDFTKMVESLKPDEYFVFMLVDGWSYVCKTVQHLNFFLEEIAYPMMGDGSRKIYRQQGALTLSQLQDMGGNFKPNDDKLQSFRLA